MSYLVDTHLHVTMMPYEGLQAMSEGGIQKAITCAIVIGAQHSESYFDHFRLITGFYKKNAEGLGIKLYSAIGVHPAGIPHDWTRVIDALPEYLKLENVVGLGEVGMNQGSQLEKDVLKAQFEVARDQNVPVIVHIPFQNRLQITELTLNIAAQVSIPANLLIIDHINLDILNQVNQFGAVPAITIRSRNVTVEALYENIEQFQHGMLNCDFSNLFPNDPTAVIKAYQYLKSKGVSDTIIDNLTRNKAEKVFNI
ncbi:TatD family hydrolase [Desulfotomaculum defluvii]